MSKFEKLLCGMRNNPAGDWDIDDIERVCNRVAGVIFLPPKRGDHYKVTHPSVQEILTIPAKRPIKAVYVQRFVSMIDSIMTEGTSGSEEPGDPSAAA
jgi:hypothetical protein